MGSVTRSVFFHVILDKVTSSRSHAMAMDTVMSMGMDMDMVMDMDMDMGMRLKTVQRRDQSVECGGRQTPFSKGAG